MIDRSLREALAHLPRLVVFVELAKHGSFRRTAEALGLSPSTVTHHIQVLEGALGIRLVERTSRSMTLTAAGLALLDEVEGIVGIWKRGSKSARAHADGAVGELVVTAPDVITERFVVPAIGVFLARHARVNVELRVSTKNLDLIAEGIDVAVRVGPLTDSGYGVRALHRGRHGIYATPALAEAWPASHPSDLRGAPWVQFTRNPEQLQLLGPEGQTHALQGRTRARASTAASFIGLTSTGVGFGLLPRTLVHQEHQDGRLVLVLPEWSFGPATFYALTPSPGGSDAKTRLFMEILAEEFRGAEKVIAADFRRS